MLRQLYIKDYALIDEIIIEFKSGLNILTGETGAGKSIIIGAMSLLLGERAKRDVIRKGASMSVVEGLFSVPDTDRWIPFAEQIETHDDGLLLRREVHESGRTRAFANDSPISNTLLAEIGDLLVDLHGQHAHQTLLKVDRHLDYLDNFDISKDLIEQVRHSYKRFLSLNSELETLKERERLLKEKKELLEFQVHEIAVADLQIDEEENLEREERILKNSERLFQASEELSQILYAGENSAVEKLSFAENTLSGLKGVDRQFGKWAQECESARIAVEEIVNAVQIFVSKVEYNPQRLEEVRERLGLLSRLKKKYGGSLEEVLRFLAESKNELDQMESIGDRIEKAERELEEENLTLAKHCEALSKKRHDSASRLEKCTVKALEELGLKSGKFKIRLQTRENPEGRLRIGNRQFSVTQRGIDQAEFFISLNPGEDPKPLTKIASGGEISRIMLALKAVLAEADEVPVLVFDEIDTGISGRIASVVGNNLHEVSRRRQVICITHLPQIAAKGEHHFSVEKQVIDNRSVTTIRVLDEEERIGEIAKLIGGERVSDSAIDSAKELLKG